MNDAVDDGVGLGGWARQAVRRWLGPAPAPAAQARAPDGERVYAIGDVHGRADLLRPLLERIRADARDAQVRVVALGDYVDRGPQSREVLDLLCALRRGRRVRSELLMGNHEETLLAFLDDASVGPVWAGYGGRETLASYGVEAPLDPSDAQGWERARADFAQALPRTHRRLLDELQLSVEAGGYLFVHAGVRPGTALDRQDRRDLLWIREPFLRHRGALARVVVHGHTPAEEPYADHRRIGVDTGAYATGVLTAVRLEGAERAWLQASRSRDGEVTVSERPAR